MKNYDLEQFVRNNIFANVKVIYLIYIFYVNKKTTLLIIRTITKGRP